jgi:hypothetical protein
MQLSFSKNEIERVVVDFGSWDEKPREEDWF